MFIYFSFFLFTGSLGKFHGQASRARAPLRRAALISGLISLIDSILRRLCPDDRRLCALASLPPISPISGGTCRFDTPATRLRSSRSGSAKEITLAIARTLR
jgi:hypothetical protein